MMIKNLRHSRNERVFHSAAEYILVMALSRVDGATALYRFQKRTQPECEKVAASIVRFVEEGRSQSWCRSPATAGVG